MIYIIYPFAFISVYIAFKLIFFLRIKGRRNLPPRGTKLLICANHTGYSDPLFVTLIFNPFRKIRYMAKSTIFKGAFKKRMLHELGAFPIEQRSSDIQSIKNAITEIDKAKPVLIFPEGSRRLRGLDNLEALPGVGLIALKADCMILPVYITPYLTPFHRKTVVVGKPYKPERLEGEKPGEAYRRIASEALEKIRDLGKEIGEGW